ncbi:MAG: protein phosphatase CheZ [SAR324 cluster bacterium]|nr:protein phosphatase CheZ [SAR324 cluster bacterium]
MPEVQQITVTKDQLLSNFSSLTQWLREYWFFLEQFPLDVFADDGQIIDHLRTQHQSLVNTQVKLHVFDMVGSVLTFALQRINPEQLTFRLPVDAPVTPEEYHDVVHLSEQAHHTELALQRVVDQVMYLSRHLPEDSEEKFTALLQSIGALFKAVIRQDGDDMKVQLSQINLLTSTKESYLLIQEVGKITREIYNSLQVFSEDLDAEQIRNVTNEMPDAVDKLNSVILKLEEAANDNLEFLEQLIQQSEHNVGLVEDLDNSFKQLEEMLTNFEEQHGEFSEDIDAMKDLVNKDMRSKAEALLNTFHENENLFLTIMTNQGFQDLTGQTLKKIVDFIEHLELRLLELIQKFSEDMPKEMMEGASEPKEKGSFLTKIDQGVEGEDIALHGPDETENKKSTQGDVDSLLADLGF